MYLWLLLIHCIVGLCVKFVPTLFHCFGYYYKAENDASSYIAANPNEFNEDGVYSVKKGLEYKIKAYNNTKDRVTYTIDFTLTKNNNKWTIDPLTDDELAKLHGTYVH